MGSMTKTQLQQYVDKLEKQNKTLTTKNKNLRKKNKTLTDTIASLNEEPKQTLPQKPDEHLVLPRDRQDSLEKYAKEFDRAYSVVQQARDKIREQDRKKKADAIRGEFDNPLDKVFNDLKPFFLLDHQSFTNLACVSKGMRQVLKNVPVCATNRASTSWKIKTIRMGLPISHDTLSPHLKHFEYQHSAERFDQRRPRVDVVFGDHLNKLSKKLESFSFTSSVYVAHDLKFQDLREGFTSLRGFQVEVSRLYDGKFMCKPREVEDNRLWLPKDLKTCFPLLKNLHLVDVTCTEECTSLFLPETLEELVIEKVKGLRELQMTYTERLREVKLVEVPDLVLTALPQGVKELFVSSTILVDMESLPSALQNLTVDDKTIDGYNQDPAHLPAVQEKVQSRTLQSVKYMNIRSLPIYNIPVAHSVFCQSCHRASKVVVDPQIHLVVLSGCYDVKEVDIKHGVQHVALSWMPELEVLIIPASCRSLAIRSCYQLKKLVFKGRAPERIGLIELHCLEEINTEEGLQAGQDIVTMMETKGKYPEGKDMSDCLVKFLVNRCEQSFVKWTEEN